MNEKKKKALLKWILDFEENSHIFAEKYGSFSLARMDFNVFISDDEIEKFNEAEKLITENNGVAPSQEVEANYYRYIQAHNHELVHYYQALTLPAFQIYQKITKNLTEQEASIMLRYFENGYSYLIGENKTVLDALENPNFGLSNSDEEKFYEVVNRYKFFVKQWKAEYKGISLFHIIEGMAHIMSMQLTPNTTNYLSGTENNPIYNMAYDVFLSYIDKKFANIDVRISHMTFLYICFFSCYIYSLPNDEIIDKTSRLFHFLSSRTNYYYSSLYELIDKYVNYSEKQLRQLDKFSIQEKDIENASKEQLAYIYSFYEIISIIEQDAKKYYDSKISISNPEKFIEVLNSLNIDLYSKYQLANFAIFPARMADIWEAYEIIQKIEIEEGKFDVAGESGFFELIDNCKNILKANVSTIACCSEHGNVNNKLEVLYCENEGGLAFYLKELTGRKALDLFKIEELI